VRSTALLLPLIFLLSPLLYGQESAEGLSRQAANPLADLMSFPVQINLNFKQSLLKAQTQLYHSIVNPNFGPEWQWRVQVQLMLPKSILGG